MCKNKKKTKEHDYDKRYSDGTNKKMKNVEKKSRNNIKNELRKEYI